MTPFTGVVLAGGRSLRMGRDKAALQHAGRTLLDIAIDALRAAGAAAVIVSGDRPGGVPDRQPGLGPVAGIDAALDRIVDGPVVVVPVDMPLLEARLLRRLADAVALLGSVTFEAHPLPWAFRADARSRRAVAHVLGRDTRGRSLRALQTSLDTASLAVPEGIGKRLVNVNTPDDWTGLGT